MQSCVIGEYGIDNRPRSFHCVFANEQHAISMHSISQETLISINLVRGGLLDYRKMRGLRDKFFAWSLHSGAEAKRNSSWTQAKAEMVPRVAAKCLARCVSGFAHSSLCFIWQPFPAANR